MNSTGQPSGSICILPQLKGLGGPVSFQERLKFGLSQRGFCVHHDPRRPDCAAILVVGGTRHLHELWRARRRGVRIVQRLDGMNWIHRKRRTGLRHALRSEVNNWILATIRRYLADGIVYQSQFSRNWWQTVYGSVKAGGRVIYNGVDLQTCTPDGPADLPQEHFRLLLVEGHLGGGNEPGLSNAIELVHYLNRGQGKPVELMVVGDVPEHLKVYWQRQAPGLVQFAGIVPHERIPYLDRSAHVLFSADLNAACPNSVIEALACGLPVVAFATGALPEILTEECGRVVPYGSNYWKLEPPDIGGLARAVQEILEDDAPYRLAARRHAENTFGLERMVTRYLDALLDVR